MLLLPAVLIGLLALYYVLGALWFHRIDDDPSFAETIEVAQGQSRAVATAAALVEREVATYRWTANDPWFQPTAILDNMPNFQQGIVAAVGRFAVELRDHLARVRGASQVDADAEGAAGRLNYPGDVWFLEWSATPVQPSSESQYRRGIEDLRRYNERLARGQATFERRADNLIAVLERIAADLGGAAASVEEKAIEGRGGWLDTTADDLFYTNKGRLYAYHLLLRALGRDMENVLRERAAERVWSELLASLAAAAALEPRVVANGAPDAQFWPNHLLAQGYLLLLARFQLYEVINILQK
ncbi:MAG: DUF2333 family protein [Geminicoccaceae bacterium]|nr:DUF2333 family protein [Geminicoccaceae bacterium]